MAAKDFWVVFTTNNARIVRGALSPHMLGSAIFNPDLSRVVGIPPHYWKLDPVTGYVVPMTEEEKFERDAHQLKHGVDNGRGLTERQVDKERAQAVKAAFNGGLQLGVIVGWLLGMLAGIVLGTYLVG